MAKKVAELHILSLSNENFSDKAEDIRDDSDPFWNALTEDQKRGIGNYSISLELLRDELLRIDFLRKSDV